MPKPLKNIVLHFIISTLVLLPGMAAAEYVFTAPPRETPDAGEKLYGPLAQHLSSLLNEKVTYKHPRSWIKYKKEMQKGSYDIVFDGPHFAAWRHENQNAQPVVKLPGTLSFVLVARKDANITNKKDLIGKKVCTLPSPNLGAMTVYSMYPNQMSQPVFTFVKGGFVKVTKTMLKGKCVGAIMRTSFFHNKLSADDKAKLMLLETSRSYVNQGFTLNARIPQEKRKLIIKSLTTGEGKKAAMPILNRFSGKAKNFVAANEKEYGELNLLKKNNMFGW